MTIDSSRLFTIHEQKEEYDAETNKMSQEVSMALNGVGFGGYVAGRSSNGSSRLLLRNSSKLNVVHSSTGAHLNLELSKKSNQITQFLDQESS